MAEWKNREAREARQRRSERRRNGEGEGGGGFSEVRDGVLHQEQQREQMRKVRFVEG